MATIVLLLAAALGTGGSPAVAGTFAVKKTFDGRPLYQYVATQNHPREPVTPRPTRSCYGFQEREVET